MEVSIFRFRRKRLNSLRTKTTTSMDAKALIIAFVRDNPNSTEAAIGKVTKLKGKALRTAIDELKEIPVLEENDQHELSLVGGQEVYDDDPIDTVIEIDAEPRPEKQDSPEAPETALNDELNLGNVIENSEAGEETGEEEAKPKPKGRDNGKFLFNGQTLGKGPLVRAVVSRHVADNPGITHDQLKEAFPDELLHRFGIFQELEKAKKYYGNRDRFFLKEEHRIKLADNTVAVCSQFTATNIVPFLARAKELGYVIENV